LETEQEPSLTATYLIGSSSTIDPADRTLVLPSSLRPCCRCFAYVFQLSKRADGPSQRGQPSPIRKVGTLTMTTFVKREETFEKKFALDEEQKFKAEARRNKLLGLWTAEKLGKSGEEATAYAREVVAAEFEAAGGVVRKVKDDLSAKGIAISEQEIRARMDELMVQAVAQVKAGA